MRKDRDDEIEREIRTHLDLEAEGRVADGMSEMEARYATRCAFGNVTRTQKDVRAVWTRRWLDESVQDVRYALRTLRPASVALNASAGQCLANFSPNTVEQQDPIRATGTRTRVSNHLRYAVSRRVAGSNPA